MSPKCRHIRLTCISFVVVILSAFASSSSSKRECEPITVNLCKGMRYSMTSMPNRFNHATQDEASLIIGSFAPLMNINCSADLPFLLCSMYTPICVPDYPRAIQACRPVCERVRDSCLPIMEQYGFSWPEQMSCHLLPAESTDDEICVDPTEDRRETEEKSPDDLESNSVFQISPEVLRALREELGPKVQWDDNSALEEEETVAPNLVRLNVPILLTPSDRLYGLNVSFGGLKNCATPCRSPYLDNEEETLETWMTILTALCALSSALSFLVHVGSLERFQYPERPLVYSNVCHLLISAGFVIRLALGHRSVACAELSSETAVSIQGAEEAWRNLACVATFGLVYYFLMAAVTWWVALCVAWFLTAEKGWCPEGISKYFMWFHLASWGIPLLWTIAVAASDSVGGDPVSGICFVVDPNRLVLFVVLPLLLKVIVGAGFLSVGMAAIWQLKSSLPSDQWTRLRRTPLKMAALSLLYVFPILILVVCCAFEAHKSPIWEAEVARRSSCLPEGQIQQEDLFELSQIIPGKALFILKTSALLASGCVSLFWELSSRVLWRWVERFVATAAATARSITSEFRQPGDGARQPDHTYESVAGDATTDENAHLANTKLLMTTATLENVFTHPLTSGADQLTWEQTNRNYHYDTHSTYI